MTLAKIVVTGTVVKNPEKRFTQSNLAVTSLVLDIYPQDSTIVRVIAYGNLADRTAEEAVIGDTVLAEGRLQTETVKTTSGKERKTVTIVASTIEKISGGAGVSAQTGSKAAYSNTPRPEAPVVQFSTEEIAEDLIDPDEIPF